MKSDKVASNFRAKADELVAVGNFFDALKQYNNCLRFATSKSAESSAAFGSRADIFYNAGLYRDCIENVKLAKVSTSIVNQKELEELEKKCESVTGESNYENEKWNFFKLSHESHQKVPFIANCVEVRENEIYGRYLATTRDLNAGDIVVLEEPFYKVLAPSKKNVRCSICLKQNSLNLIPCASCSTAMFCSAKCAESPIHKYECDMSEDNFEKALLQRMFYQAVSICGSLKELESLMSQHNASKTIMDFDFSEVNNESYLRNRILATMSLAEREPWSAEAYAKYETVTKQLNAETEDEREFLKNYLVHCLKSMTVNFFHFFWSSDESDGQGFVLCSLAAYFAHSCDPNCDKVDVDNKFAFIARKPIKADETLSICYDRYNFLTYSLEQRQEYFNRVYTFTCNCMACSKNFPSLDKLPKFDENFTEPAADFKLFRDAKEQYKKNCEYIQENIKHYPSYEICTLMNYNNRLLYSMGNDLMFLK